MGLNEGSCHSYLGQTNSRGTRKLSKLHKGVNSGDVAKAFELLDKLPNKMAKHRAKLAKKGLV